ncbi:hypothetical protein ACFY4C_32360 [Actinomadura viridis]|uniref:hypothetical protein n=1 Tax=Actinomadura viridis TaxID=58110 RepID=UPI0036994784
MTLPNVESPNYFLWQPVCHRFGSTVRCSFDVTSAEFRGINKGDARLFTGFLAAMDVCVGKLESWTVRRFVSPYHAYDPEEDDWRSLFGLAWRIDLMITDVSRYRAHGKAAAYPGAGLDPTWVDGHDCVAGDEENCVIIATEGPARDFSFLAESHVGGELELIEYGYSHATVLQARLDLGTVNLPRAAESVRELLHQAKIRFMTTDSSQTALRSAWQKPAEWTIVA